ncbi:MAG: methyltransferase domain-containing protein [Acidobacteriota bacterium]
MKPGEKPTVPLYARSLVYLIRPFPNFDFSFVRPVRRLAVNLLALTPGDRVLDAGCGTGGSFPYLVEAVGTTGHVVGVEISPETCANTRRRIESNKWQNVELINAPAQTAKLSGKFDGLLMFAAPDVYASDEALDNIFPYLNDGARLVFFGAKVPDTRRGKTLGRVLQRIFAAISTDVPHIEPAPWHTLEKRIGDIEVKEYFFGLMFLASGKLNCSE